jgi:hypothetical protein
VEDIIAIKLSDKKRGVMAFLTLGRIFDPVDAEALRELVLTIAPKMGLTVISGIEICDSLQEISHRQYFFEGVIRMAGERIPFGKKSYSAWRKKIKAKMLEGKEFYNVGSDLRRE